MKDNLQAIILAAGKSTRFNTAYIKLAEKMCGQEMILYPTKLLEQLNIPTTVVIGYQHELVKQIIINAHGASVDFVVQEKQEGTGHALACSQSLWQKDHILVLNGDVPLITAETISTLYDEHIRNNAAISFVTAYNTTNSAQGYGRIVTTAHDIAIVEAKDFTGNVTEHGYINAGIYLIKRDFLREFINSLDTNNANKEFYITDLVKIASHNNQVVATTCAPFDTISGINTLEELWSTEHIKQKELIKYWMLNGVRFLFPDQIQINLAVQIGQGSVINGPVYLIGNTSIGKNCTIGAFSLLDNVILEDNVTIHPHSVLSNAFIRSHAHIGPFAHLRSKVTIGSHSDIGNFVEIKNSTIDENSKAKHLSYIGDATIGSHVNIGAGTITCNFDGTHKHRTVIQDNSFIGSNNTLVAPIKIGSNVFTAAGSTLTADVPDNALAIARAYQTNKNDYALKMKKSAPPQEQKKADFDDFSFIGARLIHTDTPTDEQ
jgi:bifunctional UDP-N-acetylglucosamine pyrophosphorylase / glucosamine-1-phosphate N-acetyltransferase